MGDGRQSRNCHNHILISSVAAAVGDSVSTDVEAVAGIVVILCIRVGDGRIVVDVAVLDGGDAAEGDHFTDGGGCRGQCDNAGSIHIDGSVIQRTGDDGLDRIDHVDAVDEDGGAVVTAVFHLVGTEVVATAGAIGVKHVGVRHFLITVNVAVGDEVSVCGVHLRHFRISGGQGEVGAVGGV